MFRRHPLTLVLWSEDAGVRETLKKRAEAYAAKPVASRDSGFDLEVYKVGNELVPVVDGWILLNTQVHAKVISEEVPGQCFAFDMRARSSLAGKRGWMLANGVGLIDIGYCDHIRASLTKIDKSNACQWPELCAGQPGGPQIPPAVVQLVAPDAQPFDDFLLFQTEQEWTTFLSLLEAKAPDRGGGFGSTDSTGSLV